MKKFWKKKEKETEEPMSSEERLNYIFALKKWLDDPNRTIETHPDYIHRTPEEEYAIKQRMQKDSDRAKIKFAIETTIIEIICTPLRIAFSILTLISGLAIYAGGFSFLYGCYQVYSNIGNDMSFISAVVAEWKCLLFPFIASFSHVVFMKLEQICDANSMFIL